MRIDGNVYYVLKDRLGSAYATTDANGNLIGQVRYYAFGEARWSTGTILTDRLFTGQRWIVALRIYHYNARFYSPTLGRFLSADTMMSGFANPQNLNRFSYVANNPVRYTDPTGHMVWEGDGGGGGYTPAPPPEDYCLTHPSACGGGGGGGGGEGGGDDETPECDPNMPNCDPIFSGPISAQELSNISTNLNNTQSMLNYVSLGLGAASLTFLGAAAILAITPGVNVIGAPVLVGLAVVGTVYGVAALVANNEASQLSYLINEVNTMQELADSSPTDTLDVYVSTHPDYYAPALNLTYDGAPDVYVANSIVTNLALSTSFSN